MNQFRCGKCKQLLPDNQFYWNRKKDIPYTNRCKECDAFNSARRRSGIVIESRGIYDKLFSEQEGKCAICGTTNPGNKDPRRQRFCLDHDHITGKVRGLLCIDCNRAIGLLGDDVIRVQRAYQYLSAPFSPIIITCSV
jgi:hypothetical protein